MSNGSTYPFGVIRTLLVRRGPLLAVLPFFLHDNEASKVNELSELGVLGDKPDIVTQIYSNRMVKRIRERKAIVSTVKNLNL